MNKKHDLVRVNINLPQVLVDKVKEYAEQHGFNATTAYIILLTQSLLLNKYLNMKF